MKHLFSFVVFMGLFLSASAQSTVSPKKSYRQKPLLDSLHKTFGEPALQINPQPMLVYNTPVNPLKNEGEMIGMSGEDTVYRMKTDNMHVLKPNKKATYIPNSTDGKVFMVPPAKKKP